jgi:ATP-dependent helicase HrpB
MILDRLPIETILPELLAVLQTEDKLILTAAPGSGKTTRIPLALLDEPWLKGRSIVVLEPRRLAARSAASYMAGLLGEKAGQTVGYIMRQEARISNATKIKIITEGILTRKLQEDPALEDVGIVIFDEFHERSIHADLGLALCLEAQALFRPDLRIVVMSATMDTEPLKGLMGAKALKGEGQAYPVETIYLDNLLRGDLLEAVASTVLQALHEQTGDILVFLPGAGEIRRTEKILRQSALNIMITPLYSALPLTEQQAALLPAPTGQRKVILATSIAETSLTVEGVRVVVDSGLMRVPRYFPGTGLTRLETVRVTKASADQRRGRAGRLGPGICYRLWTKNEDLRLTAQNTPEILAVDLLPLALELALWGVQDLQELGWLDLPDKAAYCEAREMLKTLGALDSKGHITVHGQQMAAMGAQPRLAHMMLSAKELGHGRVAADLAALLEERDIIEGRGVPDITLRLEALRGGAHDSATIRRVRQISRQYQERLGLTEEESYDIDSAGLVLSFAYPDRLAANKGQGRFLLRSGKGVYLSENQLIAYEPYLVVPDLEDKNRESRIFLAAPISEAELRERFIAEILSENIVWWDSDSQLVRGLCRETLGEIVLKETPLTRLSDSEGAAALLAGIKKDGLKLLSWHPKDRQLQQRICFLHAIDNTWPDVSDEFLLTSLDEWLAPYVQGLKRQTDLQRLSLSELLLNLLSWEQRQKLADYAPTHIVVPSGQRIPINYTEPTRPILAVRLQEMFGLSDTPRIAGGKIALTLHLLSPAQRPVQVTQDLAGFWQSTYFAVKKDLAGRYPKHYWPDDPLSAAPTHRAKPRG